MKKILYLVVGLSLLSMPAYGAYREVTVSKGGVVKGRVTFKGQLPPNAVQKFTITKDKNVCGVGQRTVRWIDVDDGALRGVVVYIEGVKRGKPWPKKVFTIDQKGCRFEPWIQVIRNGATVIVRNSDPVMHNINAKEMILLRGGRMVKRTIFNFAQSRPGEVKKRVRTRRSPFIAINCEAHNFMFAWIFAASNPYATVVGDDGSFRIDNIPPGTYTIKAWHPRLGTRATKVTIPEGGTVKVDFTFTK